MIGRKKIVIFSFLSITVYIHVVHYRFMDWGLSWTFLLQMLAISCAWNIVQKSSSPWMLVFVIKPQNVIAFLVLPVKRSEGLPRHCQMNIFVIYAFVAVGIFKLRSTWYISRMEENWHYGMLIYLGKANFRFIHTLCQHLGFRFTI